MAKIIYNEIEEANLRERILTSEAERSSARVSLALAEQSGTDAKLALPLAERSGTPFRASFTRSSSARIVDSPDSPDPLEVTEIHGEDSGTKFRADLRSASGGDAQISDPLEVAEIHGDAQIAEAELSSARIVDSPDPLEVAEIHGEEKEEDGVADIKEKCTDYDVLVLSGCSVKGFITLGALQYLYDNYILCNIKAYIGTSSGAIICYLLIIGYTPIEIMVYICTKQLLEKMSAFNIVALLQGNGACSFNYLGEHLEKMTIDKLGFLPTMEDLYHKFGKQLICATYNLTKSRTEYISYETFPKLPCLIALRMSSNLPLVFDKFKYGKSYYIDGGISDNFPIQLAEKYGEKIIGIVLESNNNCSNLNTLEFIYRLMFIPIKILISSKIENLKNNEKYSILQLNHTNSSRFFDFDINQSEKFKMFNEGYELSKKNDF